MLTIVIPLLFVVAGVLLFALAAHPALKELGRALMWSGLFAIAFAMTGHSVHLL